MLHETQLCFCKERFENPPSKKTIIFWNIREWNKEQIVSIKAFDFALYSYFSGFYYPFLLCSQKTMENASKSRLFKIKKALRFSKKTLYLKILTQIIFRDTEI